MKRTAGWDKTERSRKRDEKKPKSRGRYIKIKKPRGEQKARRINKKRIMKSGANHDQCPEGERQKSYFCTLIIKIL